MTALPKVCAIGLSQDDIDSLKPYYEIIVVASSAAAFMADQRDSSSSLQACLCIFLKCTDAEKQDSEVAVSNWKAELFLDAPLICYDLRTAVDLRPMLQGMVANSAAMCQIRSELATLRTLHEDLQNCYNAVRDIVYNEGFLVPRIVFESEASEYSTSNAARMISQPLPIDFNRISAISVLISSTDHLESSSTSRVVLRSSDDDTHIYEWRICHKSLNKGWHTFVVNQRSPSAIRRNAVLVLEPSTSSEHGAPEFVLGDLYTNPQFCATVEECLIDKPLAIKCWSGIAGTRPTLSGQMWPAYMSCRSPITRVEIVPDSNDLLISTNVPEEKEFEVIKWDGARRWILVHPLSTEPTIAELRDVVLPGTETVYAEIETANNLAGYVEYAIAVDRPGTLPAESLKWKRVSAVAHNTLTLKCERASNASSLYLATRLPEGAISDYCWAHFKRIYLEGNFK